MSRIIRTALAMTCVLLATTGAASAAVARPETTRTTASIAVPPSRSAAEVGGVAFPGLPEGLGELSVFDSEDDGVAITTGVWESAGPDGGTAVDLSVTVVRAERFTSPVALHDWLVPWQERPADEAVYEPVLIAGGEAWLASDQVFWLLRPGVGVSITLDESRFDTAALPNMATSAHELRRGRR